MDFYGVDRPDPLRPLFTGLIELAPGEAQSCAVDLLERYDALVGVSESWRCSGPGALLWWAAVDELLVDGQQLLRDAQCSKRLGQLSLDLRQRVPPL